MNPAPDVDEKYTAHDVRPLVLVTLFGGGWHQEMNLILEKLPATHARFAYAYGYFGDVHSAAKLATAHPGPRYPIRFLGPTRKPSFHRIRNGWHFAAAIRDAFAMVRRTRPAVILGVSTASTAALFLAGRFYGSRCIYVESLTRVRQLSLTGRIVYHTRLAHAVYGQWPQLAAKYPRLHYAGAVL